MKKRFDIKFYENRNTIEEAEKQDGVFPLVTNDRSLSAKDVLLTYKRHASSISSRTFSFMSYTDPGETHRSAASPPSSPR